MARSGYGVPEDIQFLDWSESVTSQTRDEVVGLIEEHLSLEAIKTFHGTKEDLENGMRNILNGLSGCFTHYIVAAENWECPEFLKSRGE